MRDKQQHSDALGGWALGRDVIESRGNVYMRRWFFWCPWFGIRVHHILRSDPDEHVHSHPWAFISILLTGGYTEMTPLRYVDGTLVPDAAGQVPTYHPRWSILRRTSEDLHRLVLDKPVWTLVFTGPKRKSWGFLTERGMVPWREYLARK